MEFPIAKPSLDSLHSVSPATPKRACSHDLPCCLMTAIESHLALLYQCYNSPVLLLPLSSLQTFEFGMSSLQTLEYRMSSFVTRNSKCHHCKQLNSEYEHLNTECYHSEHLILSSLNTEYHHFIPLNSECH